MHHPNPSCCAVVWNALRGIALLPVVITVRCNIISAGDVIDTADLPEYFGH